MTPRVRKEWKAYLTVDNLVYLAIVTSGFVLLALFWNLGIKADDFQVLTWVRKGPFVENFKYYVENLNTRYGFFIFYRLLTGFLFDPENPFGLSFIRISFLFIVAAHTGSCLLGYRIVRDLGVRAGVAATFLPLFLFPFFGKGALIWIAAAIPHVFGLFFFILGAFFAMRRRRILFAVANIFSIGCIEYVIFPFAFAAASLLYCDWKHYSGLPFSKRILKTALGSVPSLFPPALFVSVILVFAGFGARVAKLNVRPKIWEAPLEWLKGFWTYYLPTFQPVEYLKERSFVIPLIVISVLIAVSKTVRGRLVVLMLFFLFVTSLFPLSFVGYYGPHSRLVYIPGIFFFAAFVAGFSFSFDRLSGLLSKKLFRWCCYAIAAAVITSTTWFSVKDLKRATDWGAQGFICTRDFLQHIVKETDNEPPKAIWSCGFPRGSITEENSYLSNWFSSFAMSIAYNSPNPVLLKHMGACPKTTYRWPVWKEDQCPHEVRYYIVNQVQTPPARSHSNRQ